MQNPDIAAALAALNAPGADPLMEQNKLFVQPVVALTPMMEQHQADEAAYFICSLKTAAMHRADGKKLAFIHGVLKTDIKEDIAYLREEVYKHKNPYIREATGSEIDLVEGVLNPRAAMRRSVEAELREKIRAEEREKIVAEMAAQAAVDSSNASAAVLAGVDKSAAPKPSEAAGVQVLPVPQAVQRFTPVSSTDVADATAGASSTAAAKAATMLAAMKNAKGQLPDEAAPTESVKPAAE